ncbi:MAG: hypothetical protein WD844_00895 [Thermoleophilaceae bacterium]
MGRLPRRRGFRLTDRATIAIGGVAVATTVAALAAEVARVWRHGSASLPGEPGGLLVAAEEAVAETVETVITGYREGSRRENATFNLLVSFVTSLGLSRGIAYRLRTRAAVGPFRSMRLGRRHIHHFVPGIVMAFVAGSIAILTDNERIEPVLAIPFGAGMGLTLDESALLLELEDVYWTEEGVVGAQIALGVMAVLAALAIGLRFTRRGERIVLPLTPPTVAPLPSAV